jgi:ubiquinone biosynthesis monooxygenase Coq7
MADEIRHMMDQEVEHLETFDSLLNERQVRPSLLDPLWGAAGFTLGVVTAAMGPKAAMACTIAVEEVIGEHYQKQADILGEDERELQATVERFRDDELEHRDIAVEHDGLEARHYSLLRKVIQRGCRTAIKIAEKV